MKNLMKAWLRRNKKGKYVYYLRARINTVRAQEDLDLSPGPYRTLKTFQSGLAKACLNRSALALMRLCHSSSDSIKTAPFSLTAHSTKPAGAFRTPKTFANAILPSI